MIWTIAILKGNAIKHKHLEGIMIKVHDRLASLNMLGRAHKVVVF